jgi:hypothetical protein
MSLWLGLLQALTKRRFSMKLHPEIKVAVQLAARFGYISQSGFKELVSTKKITMQYQLWKRMKDLKIFVPYNYRYKSEEFLRLTKQGKILASQLGTMPIHAPQITQLPHEELLVRFTLLNERSGQIKDVLTEADIKSSGKFLRQIGHIKTKLPDLYFKINLPDPVKIAVEYERTRKSNERYRQLLLSYIFFKEVDAVLYITSSPAIEETIRAVAIKNNYSFESRPLLFAQVSDVLKNPTNFLIKMRNRSITFDEFVKTIGAQQSTKVNVA